VCRAYLPCQRRAESLLRAPGKAMGFAGQITANPIGWASCANSTPTSHRGAQSGSETEVPSDQGHSPRGLLPSMSSIVG
jgi:hypothetical protein